MSSTHKNRVNSFFGYGYRFSFYSAATATILPTFGFGLGIYSMHNRDNTGNTDKPNKKQIAAAAMGSAASILLLPLTLPIMATGLTASFALLACTAIGHALSYAVASVLDAVSSSDSTNNHSTANYSAV